MTRIADRLAELSPAKRKLFLKRLKKEAANQQGGESQPGSIPRAARDGAMPLSFAQERLWFLDQLLPDVASYNLCAAIRMKGRLDLASLGQSLRETVRRHEVLRTTFPAVAGRASQVIAPLDSYADGEPLMALRVVDLREMPGAEREAETLRLANVEANTAFDLARGPLIRSTVLRVANHEHVLLMTMHHIIADGWSLGILVREMSALYGAFSAGEPSPLLELSIQYVDFAQWQRQWLTGETLENQLSFWKQHLAELPVLELPADRARPALQSHRGAREVFELTGALTEELKGLSRREGATLFMTLLAAFKIILHRYGGQEDIGVGSPIANRNRWQTEGLIGLFANLLLLRTKFLASKSFRDLLSTVREVTLRAYDHQDVPFEKVVEELNPERSLSHSPLVQVTFGLLNAPRQDLDIAGLELSHLAVESYAAKFDLAVSLDEKGEGLKGLVEYNSDLFDASTIARLISHFQTLLESILADPDRPISTLKLMTEAERHQVLTGWNNTRADYPRSMCINQLIEAQARRTPHNAAVIYEGGQLTYSELNRRANQLSHYLRTLGVGPEVLVGVCLERGFEMVIAILAVLKAGAAYVPLDPSHPKERLELILEDAQCPVLITQQHLIAALPEVVSVIVSLDAEWGVVARYGEEDSTGGVSPDNSCYVIYTSGSTGKPKGVQIQHGSVVNLLAYMRQLLGVTHLDRVLSVTTLSFDIAALEIYLPLTVGACAEVISHEVAMDGAALIAKMTASAPTIMQATPATWRGLLDAGWPGDGQLKMLSGGEALGREQANEMLKRGGSLWNLYGPTETTIYSTGHEVKSGQGPVSIGRPINNTQAYILDRNLQPLPVGLPGELYIGGSGLARGYLNNPDLTAERFVPDPFSESPGARLYRTGDLARYLPDGNIGFLGRNDYQVKVRGFRIELGEVESALADLPAVAEAVVDVGRDKQGEKMLVGYVVLNEGQQANATQLRAHLKQKLPDYMLPSAFVLIESLPLTPNGKVDRRALLKLEVKHAATGASFVAPRNPVEEVLCGIWRQALGAERVGVEDNFFDLGGHSLLATQVISRAKEAFSVNIPLRELFERPTVAGLSESIERAKMAGRTIRDELIPRAPRGGELPLSFAQQRMWFLEQLEQGSPFYNIPAAIRLKGEVNLKALEQTFNELIRRHESLRTEFTSVDGSPAQVIIPGLNIEIPIVDLSRLPEAEREDEARNLTCEQSQVPFDLARAPLLRISLLRLNEQEHVLLLVMHHIVSDGWSMGVLVREIGLLYEANAGGKESPLSDLQLQYADYAAWQRGWLRGEALEDQLSYWATQLEGASAVLALPTDRPRPAVQSYSGGRLALNLSRSLTDALKSLSLREDVTLFMTLLGAFAALLHRYTGQEDISLGTPIANRHRIETEAMIGCFVNTLVLRTKLSGQSSFQDVLRRVRDAALGAYANQDLPFEKLVDRLDPERSLGHTPLFQAMFVMQNAPMTRLELQGLSWSQYTVHNGTAAFDITLSLEEAEQGLAGFIDYSEDLFDAGTMRRMMSGYETLLEGIVEDAGRRISELPVMTEGERSMLLAEWNATDANYPADFCIHELVARQALQTPAAIAIEHDGEQLTYFELNARANQLGGFLRKRGVGPESMVGVFAQKSLEMAVAVLGILKAGGAYVPMDPAYPVERLTHILEETGLQVLITEQPLLARLPDHRATVIRLDADRGLIESEDRDGPADESAPENSAYLVYTSGTTGKPKGIVITHRSIVNASFAFGDRHELRPRDRLLQFASISFDVAAEELFSTWLSGATVVLPSADTLSSYDEFGDFVRSREVSVLNLPASYWHGWINEVIRTSGGLPQTLRLVIVGNEATVPEGLQKWQRLSGDRVEWRNAYGPTEATVTCMNYTPAPGHSISQAARVPIGRPTANARVYVLDGNFNLAPVGVCGELYVGGKGMARGYFKKPDETAEKFLPDPFGLERELRMYRTGDLARHLPDGNVEFLGRKDDQVKVRGYRIELGEIESALSQHPSVLEAVVVAQEHEPGRNRLIAYVTIDADAGAGAAELREYLREKLPEYMLPAAFVILDRMPKTVTGKVDRKALPAPDWKNAEGAKSAQAPRTPAERALAEIWRKVLGVEQVGVHENFFDLGGDSIMSIQIVARANQAGIRLTARQLFQHQTIAGLATVADAPQAVTAEQGAVTGPVPLTAIQRWFFDQNLKEPHHYNQALMLELKREVEAVALKRVVERLVDHHDALRMRFSREAAGWRQVNAPAEEAEVFAHMDLSAAGEARQRQLIRAEAARLHESLSLSEGPLIRVALFDLGLGRRSCLLIVIHHLVVDGVSWRILLEDLQLGVQQLSSGEEVSLPAKTTSFKHWAERITEYARTDEIKREASYWVSQLGKEFKPLPVDIKSDDRMSAALSLTVELSEDETRALLQDVPATYHTQVNDALLTALALAYWQWSGEPRLLVDLEGHGREEISGEVDVSRTVGWFTTIFPVALEPGGGSNPGDCLKLIKEQLRRLPNRGMGYGLLQYLCDDEQTVSALRDLPCAEMAFNYLGQVDQSVSESNMFGFSRESSGDAVGPRERRSHLIEINGAVAGRRLRMEFTYSENSFSRASMENFAARYTQALGRLIEHCRTEQVGGHTPSDFPLAGIGQQDLDRLEKEYHPVEDLYPLSPMQEGMLFQGIVAPDSEVYIEQLSCLLRGDLNVMALKRAWQQVVNRHSILRAAYVWERLPWPLQVISEQVALTWVEQDWRSLPPAEQQHGFESYLDSDRGQAFELARPPLMRLALIRVADDAHYFSWSHHHLLLDGWSMPLVFREVFTIYGALCRGEDVSLEAPPPYRNYIEWLRRQDPSTSEQFWRQYLKGFAAPTHIDMARPAEAAAGQGEGYKEESLQLSQVTTSRLNSAARQHQLTLSTIVQGAWALLLSRLSGQDDVVYGAVVSGRPAELPGVDMMVGLFINTIPIRAQIPTHMSVLGWLRQLQESQVELRQHEHSPLVEIQSWSEVPRATPLFETIMAFENYPVGESFAQYAEGLTVSDLRAYATTIYALTLKASPAARMPFTLGYDSRRFDVATIERLLGYLTTLVEAIAADPSRRLPDLPLMSGAESDQILYGWNDTEADYSQDKCIQDLFESQVERTPDSVAVIFEDRLVSYAELNRQANRLARQLKLLGVGPGAMVAIFMDRCAEMIPALLGILKAGGAYVPIETSFPDDRIRWIVSALDVRCVVTQSWHVVTLEDVRQACRIEHFVFLDDCPPHEFSHREEYDGDFAGGKIWTRSDLDRLPCENLPPQAEPGHLAYVIFTSGSTGTPKGVVVRHKPVINLIEWINKTFNVSATDRVLFITSLCFDLSVYDVFGLLAAGGSIRVASDDDIRDPEALLRVLCDEPVTYWDSAPAALQQVATFFDGLPEYRRGGSLRLVFLSGDWIPLTLPDAVRRVFDNAEVISLGGATEATVWSNYYPIAEVLPQWASIPYGRPIQNSQYYILDSRLRPCTVGVAGALYIGGECLCSGYAKDPAQTAEKFIPNPFTGKAGERIYKTGDMARFFPDGNIEFLGRIDHQVKIRGFRIELGEIEAVISQHASVQEAVVLAREDSPGHKRLVAYVIAPAASEAPALVSELRGLIKSKLPEYMTVSAFVMLNSFPVTPNGKLDRRALPPPEQAGSGPEEVLPHAGDPVEELLASIWAEVLGVERVRYRDNFFELGGHSLLATAAISRVRETFSLDVPLRSLFESPTVAGLAAVIKAQINSGASALAEPITAVPRTGKLALSSSQQRLWFIDQFEEGGSIYNISVAVRLSGRLNVEALEHALGQVIRRHEILRTRFVDVDGEPAQVIDVDVVARLPLTDLSALRDPQRETRAKHVMRAEAQRPFILREGPLIRASLLKMSELEHVALITTHHIVSDGWSMDLLLNEIAIIYGAHLKGHQVPLEELPIQYADYADWQREWLQSEAYEKQLAYWNKQLGGTLPVLDLATDRPRPPVQTYQGASLQKALAKSLSDRLRAACRREGVTVFMLLLAAFKTMLYRYTGREDILVGTPIANRNRVEIEGLIGLFVNTLVVRTDLSGNPTFRELLSRVRQVAIEAYAHQDMPFEKLVEELQPERDLSRTPVFQVMFDMQNAVKQERKLSELSLTPLDAEAPGAQFDMTLSVFDGDEAIVVSQEFNTDLFERSTIELMLGHFEAILEAVADSQQLRLSDIQMLSPAETRQLLFDWNDTKTDLRRGRCVHELFSEQARRTPHAVAVEHVGERLSYSELDERASRLAHYLQERGAGPEALVGIYVERSIDMVVGLLGILKAGAAYVPLDPAYPAERLSFILADTGATLLLTQRHLASRLAPTPLDFICLDEDRETINRRGEDGPKQESAPSNLAYVIYTSGTAGKPKGVGVPHEALSNTCLALATRYCLRPEDRVLQFASISFDVAAEEIFPSLLAGATVVLRPDQVLDSYDALLRHAEVEGLTVLNLPSRYWHEWATHIIHSGARLPACLRLVVVGGEKVLPDGWRAWHEAIGSRVELKNAYGPTEAAITSTIYEQGFRSEYPGTGCVPIGRPIANVTAYLLDAFLGPVAVGVAGELYVGGSGLARGYVNQPDLTAEKFIPNPFGGEAGSRLYKTGDVARYLKDGNIEFRGRADDQVKIRGYRIEPAEVESILIKHAAIRDAAVVAWEDSGGDRSLVAYITIREAGAIAADELRGYLKEKLPDYMVPSAIMIIEELPMTPGGKVDRRALPRPERGAYGHGGEYAAPATQLEKVISNIWREVLSVEQVGLHDNFFELGGHSLLAARLNFYLREIYQTELPLRSIFESPTVAGLARTVEAFLAAGAPSATVTETTTDLNDEAVLDPAIYPEAAAEEDVSNPRRIFLTGATGFLGAFLLDELLRQTEADIYCLVRASDPARAREKIRGNLQSYGIWDDSTDARIIPVLGDLSKPLLGLTGEEFQSLANTIQVIYHNGAMVNQALPYHGLKAANVLGTQEVVRFACRVKAKPLHYVSTLSVFANDGSAEGKPVREDDELGDGDELQSGYAQSKWVAEKLAAAARSRGLPVSIYRPGYVTGHSLTGVSNTDDFRSRVIKSCIQIGSMPAMSQALEMTPVDYVSGAIAHLSKRKESLGKNFHILNPNTIGPREFTEWIKGFGYSLAELPYEDWRLELINRARQSRENALHALLPLFSDGAGQSLDEQQLAAPAAQEFDYRNTAEGLEGASIAKIPSYAELLNAYFSYFVNSGFFDPPQVMRPGNREGIYDE